MLRTTEVLFRKDGSVKVTLTELTNEKYYELGMMMTKFNNVSDMYSTMRSNFIYAAMMTTEYVGLEPFTANIGSTQEDFDTQFARYKNLSKADSYKWVLAINQFESAIEADLESVPLPKTE